MGGLSGKVGAPGVPGNFPAVTVSVASFTFTFLGTEKLKI